MSFYASKYIILTAQAMAQALPGPSQAKANDFGLAYDFSGLHITKGSSAVNKNCSVALRMIAIVQQQVFLRDFILPQKKSRAAIQTCVLAEYVVIVL